MHKLLFCSLLGNYKNNGVIFKQIYGFLSKGKVRCKLSLLEDNGNVTLIFNSVAASGIRK